LTLCKHYLLNENRLDGACSVSVKRGKYS
jgi:hypothetical protein